MTTQRPVKVALTYTEAVDVKAVLDAWAAKARRTRLRLSVQRVSDRIEEAHKQSIWTVQP